MMRIMRLIHSVAILAIICIMLQISISNGSPDDEEISHIDGYVFEAYSDGTPIIFAWISIYDNNTLINKALSEYLILIKAPWENLFKID